MSDSIHVNGKELKDFGVSTTGASFLFDLGYVYHSTERERGAYKINAGVADHQNLINYVESVEYWLTDSSKAVGAAIAALKFDDINEDSIRDLGYLVSGLGDLQSLINSVRNVIEESKEQEND